ncbi:MAG TPA: farnesyl diphosphate synthase [Candidatus Binataceae bacterium]|nr:farnesyl diphosphate synthase [Candidatus Binataceae bacterium]
MANKSSSIREIAPASYMASSLLRKAEDFAFERYLADRAALVERELQFLVAAPEGPAGRLFEAMRYSLLAGGKRLRPILALAACEAVGGPLEAALGFGCAVEMIHTYSLIHDDLPCMDDDDLRRGRPTNHKVFGEAIATLAGDGLLTDAFKVLARASISAGVPGSALIETIAELAEAAGSAGMVGGQVMDLLGEGRDLMLSELEVLHGRKTGALFVASVCGGARLGCANEAQLAALREYARSLGLAFQVADDLLDVEASSEQIGKRTQKDQARGKATYPALIGVERSRALANDLAAKALHAVAGFDRRAEPLRALASYAVERQL